MTSKALSRSRKVRRMNKTSFKQYDTRWASLPYPKKPWLIKQCGCGEVSVCNVIIEMTRHAKQTPKTIQPYMAQWAEPHGCGTYHAGIPAAMRHYGLLDVKEHATMAQLWAELKKGGRVAVLLMGKYPGGSKKVRWTGSGHFVACTGYKAEGGKHWLYIKDPATTSALRNGWITYEDNIRGDCLKVWSGQLPKEAKAKPKTVQDKICDWAKKIAADDSWHYVTFSMKDRKTHECAICKKHPKGKYHGWNCIGFAFASWRHGGGIPCNCSCGVFGNEEAEKMLRARKALPIAQKLIGVKELRILRNGGKNIPQSELKKGDICLHFSGEKYRHTSVYMGGGKMADATTKTGISIRKASACKIAIRYTGKGAAK